MLKQLISSDEAPECAKQCAGLAIYRANVCKKPRDRSILTLPADREAVFAAPSEFRHHHTTKENP